MPADNQSGGHCDPAFGAARDAFAENFAAREEIGASFSVTIDGVAVVDLWGGWADPARTRPWDRDTLVNVYSTTKGVVAIAVHRLVERGELDLDAPVSRYWPGFECEGKGGITVRMLLNHRAGLPALHETLPGDALFDWGQMTSALEAEKPWWPPGEKHGYHAITYGWLVGEVIARISGKRPGRFIQDEIAGPLGLDFHLGMDAVHDARTAEMTPPPMEPPETGEPALLPMVLEDPDSVTAKAFMNPPTLMELGVVNTRAWRGAEIPAANGHTTARALARLYGALACGGSVDGHKVLSPESIARCHTEESRGPDEVLVLETRFGPGFMLSQEHASFGPGTRSFGHPGAGGSLGFADPDRGLGFGYTMNRMGPNILLDPRATVLIDAVYGCL